MIAGQRQFHQRADDELAVTDGGTGRELADGEVVVRAIMELTLTCDHRILYGADAAEFLAKIREYLETPLKLAL